MTVERKIFVSKAMRELYLYPYRSKEENTIRCAAWMASWIVGIVIQPAMATKTLGGAYLIFAISLMLEFVPERRELWVTKIIHGIFCSLLFGMLIGAIVVSFTGDPAENSALPWIYLAAVKALPYIGWILFIAMLISLVLSMIEAHKIIYDEEAEKKREAEDWRRQFYENLHGPGKGGNTL